MPFWKLVRRLSLEMLRKVLCAMVRFFNFLSLLFFAWMRTAIVAGGIAVLRSGKGYVEGVTEV